MFVTYGTPHQICETSPSHSFVGDAAAFWALRINPEYALKWLQQMKMNAYLGGGKESVQTFGAEVKS
jgi:hypothetical protein